MGTDTEAQALRFEDIEVGTERELTHTLTAADVEAFASLTGDRNPLHVDPAYAARTPFQKPVVHGMLSASYISTIIGMRLPGSGALWTSQTLEFLRPAFLGDTIRVTARVAQKSPATRVLRLDVRVTNQHGQELVVGQSTVKVLEPSQPEAKSVSETQNVIITGASGGIGAAIARKLAARGHAVTLSYAHNAAAAEALADELGRAGARVFACRADTSVAAEVQAMVREASERFGVVDGLVHCAAPANAPVPLESLTWEAVQEQLDVMVKGAFHLLAAALPGMIEAKRGSVVLVSSIYAEGAPPPQQARYVIAKAALEALARSAAVELGPKGIRVNVVAPGITQTEMIANLPDKVKILARMNTPLRRLGEPDDVAEAVAFLMSPGARHITGEVLKVCGGAVM